MALSGSTSPGMIRGGAKVNAAPDKNTTGGLNPPPSFSLIFEDSVKYSSLQYASTYYYKITAVEASGETLASAEGSITLSGYGLVRLFWGPVDGATGYKIYRGTSAGSEDTLIATITDGSTSEFDDCGNNDEGSAVPATNTTSPTISAPASCSGIGDNYAYGLLTPGATYYYQVTAYNESAGVYHETTPCAEISVVAGTNGAIFLEWEAVSGAMGYRIYRSTSSGAETRIADVDAVIDPHPLQITDTGSTNVSATPPTSNTTGLSAPVQSDTTPSDSGGFMATGTYYYEITATDFHGETTASNEKSAAVTGPTGSVDLAWGEVTGATGYKIYRGTSASGENILVATIGSGATTTYTDTIATPPVALTGFTVEHDWTGKDGNTLAIATFGNLGSAVDVVVTDRTGEPFEQLGEYAESAGFAGVAAIRLSLWKVPPTANVIKVTTYTMVPAVLIIFDADHSASVATAGAGNNTPPSVSGNLTLIAFYGDPIAWPPKGSLVSPDYTPGAGFSTVKSSVAVYPGDDPSQRKFMLYLDQGDGTNTPTFTSLPQWWAAIGLQS